MPHTDKDIVEIALKEKTHDEVVISLLANKAVSVNTLVEQGRSCVYKLIINAMIREISNKLLGNFQETVYEEFLEGITFEMPYIDYSHCKIIITAGIENGEYVLPEMSKEEAAIAVTHTASQVLIFTKDDNFENVYKSIDKTINTLIKVLASSSN